MSDFGEKFKKAFKIGGSSKDPTETGSPLATGAHGASGATKVQCHPGGPLVLQRFRCSAQAKSSGDPAGHFYSHWHHYDESIFADRVAGY
jgi:hypothetical protein